MSGFANPFAVQGNIKIPVAGNRHFQNAVMFRLETVLQIRNGSIRTEPPGKKSRKVKTAFRHFLRTLCSGSGNPPDGIQIPNRQILKAVHLLQLDSAQRGSTLKQRKVEKQLSVLLRSPRRLKADGEFVHPGLYRKIVLQSEP